MFQGLEIFRKLERVRGFIPKCWTNIWQSKLDILIFQNYILIENYSIL